MNPSGLHERATLFEEAKTCIDKMAVVDGENGQPILGGKAANVDVSSTSSRVRRRGVGTPRGALHV